MWAFAFYCLAFEFHIWPFPLNSCRSWTYRNLPSCSCLSSFLPLPSSPCSLPTKASISTLLLVTRPSRSSDIWFKSCSKQASCSPRLMLEVPRCPSRVRIWSEWVRVNSSRRTSFVFATWRKSRLMSVVLSRKTRKIFLKKSNYKQMKGSRPFLTIPKRFFSMN